jgi:hypothetical protein
VKSRGAGWRWKLALLMLVVALLPASALADQQVDTTRGPFGGMLDLQPGAINGHVTLDAGSASLQATQRDPGVDGQLQVTIPGQFAGTATASNGELSYDLTVCGVGTTFSLQGTSGSNLHVSFQDSAANPNGCNTAPAPATAQQPLLMSPLMLAAQAQPAGATTEVQSFLANWLRRLIGLALVALLLVLLIPAMPRALTVATETPPWGRIGLGAAVAVILPLIGILIFAIGLPIGLWWLGVILLALYPVLLILSLSVSGLSVGSWLSRRVSRPGVPLLVVFGVGLLILSFLSLLPYVGPIVNIAAVTFGLGTLVLAPRSRAASNLQAGNGVPTAPDVAGGPVSSTPVPA